MPIQQYTPASYMRMVDTTLHRLIGDLLPDKPILFLGHHQRGIDLETKTLYAQTYCRVGLKDTQRPGLTWGVRAESSFPDFQDGDSLMTLNPVLRRYAFFGLIEPINRDVLLESDDFLTVSNVVIGKGFTPAESKVLTPKYEPLKGKSLEEGITALVQSQ